ncbi:MAG: hypothetical protein QOI21_324 [Actinomycetota bacterium]|jgi:hypothetical protein|nr:hypothetical protein [Actinomycetota bacterium]
MRKPYAKVRETRKMRAHNAHLKSAETACGQCGAKMCHSGL